MNVAYDRFQAFAELVTAGELERALAMTGESFSWRMHDSGGFEFNRDDLETLTEFTAAIGGAAWTTTPIDVRGERWMMAALVATQVESQFQSEWIMVGELDPSGLVARAARFSGDDQASVAALLDAWAAVE